MDSNTFEVRDTNSLNNAMQGKSTVEPIQKEESSYVTDLFMNPTQTKATSKDDLEKGAFLTAVQ